MARWFPDGRISRIHGQSKRIDERYVIPMYHPAAALRNGSLRDVMHADFAKIPALLRGDPLPQATPPAPQPQAVAPPSAPVEQTERLL